MNTLAESFLNQISSELRADYGYVAVIDIAALKLKNALLGVAIGDCEISDLETIIQQQIARELIVRVAGDQWLLFFNYPPLRRL